MAMSVRSTFAIVHFSASLGAGIANVILYSITLSLKRSALSHSTQTDFAEMSQNATGYIKACVSLSHHHPTPFRSAICSATFLR